MNQEIYKYSFAPSFAADAEFLILGSLPGEESLRRREYYGYPRNAFWPIMATLFDFSVEMPYEDRLAALRRNRVALWDVLEAAVRPGSLDSAIRDWRPNPLDTFVKGLPQLRRIGCNGGTAHRLLLRHFPELEQRFEVVKLPSTSPAAAMWTRTEKLEAYRRFFSGL